MSKFRTVTTQSSGQNRWCATWPIQPPSWPRWGAAMLVCQSLMLGACASPNASTPSPAVPTPSASANQVAPQNQNLRVIVKFRQPVAYSEAAFLQTLSQHVGAQVVYLSSVSADTHVYLLKLQATQTPQDLLQRLSTVPSVLWAEVDAVARAS